MSRRHFFISQMAVILTVQLLRFPHLILEQGGGAFLILFFITLHLVALPLMITETVMDRKLRQFDLYSFLSMNQNKRHSILNRTLVFTWFSLRFVVLLVFLWYFLYLSGGSFMLMMNYGKSLWGETMSISDLASTPDLQMSPFLLALWVGIPLLVFLKIKRLFLRFSTQWILPICFAVVLALFCRVLFSMNDFEGLKTLLYPDFSALQQVSPISVIGHSLVSLFIGIGCFNISYIQKPENDPIQMFIQSIIQALLLALLVGVMAVPMIEQVSETSYGAKWVFDIFPRWLSYGDFGSYYCVLFFLTMTFIAFYLTVLLLHLMSLNVNFMFRRIRSRSFKGLLIFLFLFINVKVLAWLQKNMEGWWADSLTLKVDFVVVNFLLPVLSLLMTVVVFQYTRERERMEVFAQQQVFFHNRFFFKNWQWIAAGLVPVLILISWAIAFR